MATVAERLHPAHPFIGERHGARISVYGARLVAVALFGSVARRTAHVGSDLDVFVVIERLPRGHRARLATFDAVEELLASSLEGLARSGAPLELSPVLRTPEDP